MAAIAALRTAFGALRRNPVLFLGGLVYGIVVLPQNALQLAGFQYAPFLLQILTFFVTPFVLAGLIGMADEAIDADTSLGTLRAVGADKYVPFLIGRFVELAINLIFVVAFFAVGVAAVLAVGVGSVAGGSVSPGVLAAVGLVVLALVLIALAVSFLIQFFPVFIVVAESDAIDAFVDSYRFVRRNLVATLGYSVVQILIGVAVAAPLIGFTVYRTLQSLDPSSVTSGGTGAGAGTAGAMGGFSGAAAAPSLYSTPEVVAIALISVAVTMLGLAIQQAYAVAFYRRHANGGVEDDATLETTGGEDDAVDADDGVSRTDDDESEWRYE